MNTKIACNWIDDTGNNCLHNKEGYCSKEEITIETAIDEVPGCVDVEYKEDNP